MATYCVGDIQGCFTKLKQLLQEINYNEARDYLWCVGDLVNRGPNSLEVLRFIRQLPNAKIVLGNHDLHLLNFYNGIVDFETEHLEDILAAHDGQELIDWLRCQPLIYHDVEHNAVLVHAGIYPGWELSEALAYGEEAAAVLRSDNYVDFLKHMYGNEPNCWQDALSGWERLRFIVNAFTRMRFCDLQGRLEFVNSGNIETGAKGFYPWFKIPWRKTRDLKIIFGHWAALAGQVDNEPNVYALDTGCVWGGVLTALRLDDGKFFSV